MSRPGGDAPLRARPQRGVWSRLVAFGRQNRLGVVAAGVLLLLMLAAVAAPLLAPSDPIAMAPQNRLLPPGEGGVLGADIYGRDLLSRILFGTRISLLVGAGAVVAAAVVGSLLGLLAGYLGRWPDYLIGRVMDVIFAFPGVLLAILVISVVGAGFASIIVAIGTVYTPIFVRVVRGSTLPLTRVEFVQAAVASGASTGRVLLRHILPNVAAPILVQLALSLSGAVILEAALSYLGLGAVPPTPSLGSMLSEARPYMELAPWAALYPGLALALLVLAINLFGDAVRDWLDPRIRGRG